MNGNLRWKFDVSAFRLIGRDLITDRVTALFELVKNSYDANAQKVTVTFSNVGIEEEGPDSQIEICDDGYGMTLEDIQNKWMVIGTSSKRKNKYSPDPFNRRCVGEKGIGRFAVDKLGNEVNIITKKEGEAYWVSVDINWEEYQRLSQEDSSTYFTDIDNQYELIPAEDITQHGTKLIIKKVRDIWTKNDVNRFSRESSRIVSPFSHPEYPFIIYIKSDEFSLKSNSLEFINSGETDIATLSGKITFTDTYQESLIFDESSVSLTTQRVPLKSFGGIKMSLFYFDGKARRIYNSRYKNNHIDGIKIYRDGLITTPFAETEDDPDRQRDVLGIEKARWKDLFFKVSNREIIGYIDITKEGNPQIIDSTNRQDFSDTPEYRELKDFVQVQLEAINNYKRYISKKNKSDNQKKIEDAHTGISNFTTLLEQTAASHPEVGNEISALITNANAIKSSLSTAIRYQKQVEKDFEQRENNYMSLLRVQSQTVDIVHAVKTSLSRIKNDAEFFNDFYPNEKFEVYFKDYAKEMYHEMIVLGGTIKRILKFSQSNLKFENLAIIPIINRILDGYKLRFAEENITLERDMADKVTLFCNEQFISDIIENLMDNSIKALSAYQNKIIKVSAYIEDEHFIMLFSDNGPGIPKEKWQWVFGLYNTTTAEQGGAGVGLFVVRSRVKALGGKVHINDSEFGNLGTTVKIDIPLISEIEKNGR